MAEQRFAAVDLGAQSGRVAVGRFDGDALQIDVVHRFANHPVHLPDGLHWNITQLFAEVINGLRVAAEAAPLDGIGIDTWGCDYALLDRGGRMLGTPFHYRDPTRSSRAVTSRSLERVSAHDLYSSTGIQMMPINTLFQLSSEIGDPRLEWADRIALMPDLLAFWLTGTLVNELTVASTTGLLAAGRPTWDAGIAARLGLPARLFEHGVATPGTDLGSVIAAHTEAGAAIGTQVRTVGGHDTASAFAAAPMATRNAAVLSSGTWSLLGVHAAAPVLTEDAERFNLTNERAVDGNIMLRRNVMGMWLVEECRREPGAQIGYDELLGQVAAVAEDVPIFDPDDDSLLTQGAMSSRIAALCAASGQQAPSGRPELFKSIFQSLACKYRLVVERLENVTAQDINLIQVVGGGSQNQLLCQLTADVTGRKVIAGPTEATLLGNVLVQLLATGAIDSLAQGRQLVARSVSPIHYEPGDRAYGDATYQRFLETTGLQSPRSLRAGV